MKTRLLFAILLVIVLALILKYGAASAAPFTHNHPPATAAFGPGPNLETEMREAAVLHLTAPCPW
jgi:hypothetical protein